MRLVNRFGAESPFWTKQHKYLHMKEFPNVAFLKYFNDNRTGEMMAILCDDDSLFYINSTIISMSIEYHIPHTFYRSMVYFSHIPRISTLNRNFRPIYNSLSTVPIEIT
jgi:hypothetical protein